MNALAQIEHNVASTLLDPFTCVPAPIDETRRLRARAARHFGGNDIIGLLIRALAARYPVVRRLAGDESFLATARRFVRTQPSHLSTVLHFGEAFPGYLRSLGRAASFEYLADVAEIEAARARAMRSADARPIGKAALASLSSARMRDEISVLLHPSVSLVASRFPIVTVWAANQANDGDGVVPQWGPQAALVARPFLDVDVVPLSAGGYAFLHQLVEGASLAAAMAAAAACDPASDPAAYLRLLMDTNIVVGVHRSESLRQIELI
jgi:hypothetical protein